KAKVEQYLKASRVPHTIIRPVAFMDNYASPWMTASLQRGIMEVPLPPATRQQLVAVKDIGEFVARAVDDPKAAIGKTVELAGEELAFGDLRPRCRRNSDIRFDMSSSPRKRPGKRWVTTDSGCSNSSRQSGITSTSPPSRQPGATA